MNSRGKKIFIRRWFTEEDPEAIIIFQHGFGEHSGCYEHLAEEMNRYGIAVAGIDFEGHGHSPGLRGDIKKIEFAVEDMLMVRRELASKFPEVPIVIGGHSIGGLIAAHTVFQYPDSFEGLIMTAPLLGFASNVPRIVQETAKYVNSMAATFPIMTLDYDRLGSTEAMERMHGDELVHQGKLRARLVAQVHEFGEKIAEAMKNDFPVPFWIGHGDADAFADHQKSLEIKNESDDERSFVSIYQSELHFLLHDKNGGMIRKDIKNWVYDAIIRDKELNSYR